MESISSSGGLVAVLMLPSLFRLERLSWFGSLLGRRQRYFELAFRPLVGLLGWQGMLRSLGGQHLINDEVLA